MGFSQTCETNSKESPAMADDNPEESVFKSSFSRTGLYDDKPMQQLVHPHDKKPNRTLALEKTSFFLTGLQFKDVIEPETDNHQPTMDASQLNNRVYANFASGDMRYLYEIEEDKSDLRKADECRNGYDNIYEITPVNSFAVSVGDFKLPLCVDLEPEAPKEEMTDHGNPQSENIETTLPFFQETRDASLSNSAEADTGGSTSDPGVSGVRSGDFSAHTNLGSLAPHVSTKTETTQTEEPTERLTVSKGTMTEASTVDCSVSTHGTPCRLVRHCGTTTTGPFMKKLRRAQRLLMEARETSRSSQASTAAKWGKVLDRYKNKMEALTDNLAKKDELMGCTSSRVTVLRWEIKEALLAVRSSTSTKERLNTQCKLNAALMDVIESKSDNPTYGADLLDPPGSLNREKRGSQ